MSPQVWQKGVKAQPYCQHFQAVDVKVTFLLRPGAEAGLPSRKSNLEASVQTTFLLQTMPRGTPRSIHCRSFQCARAAMQAWFTLTRGVRDVTPSVWRNSRFQPVLKRPHVKQAQLKYHRHWYHEAQHPLKRFEEARDSEFEWSRELLNGQYTFWHNHSPHSGWVDNCYQEQN